MDKKKTGIVTLAIFLSGLAGLNIPTDTYYCEDRDIVKQCLRLSSTHKTCYNNMNRGYRCFSLWKPIEQFVRTQDTQDFTLDPDGVHCYQKGNLQLKGIIKGEECVR